MVVLFHHQGKKQHSVQSGHVCFFIGDLVFYIIVLGREGITPHWLFVFMLSPSKWRYQGHIMGTRWIIVSLKVTCKKTLCLYKGEFPQEIWVSSMVMWYIVPVKNFIVPVLNIKIGLRNDVLSHLLDLIESDV